MMRCGTCLTNYHKLVTLEGLLYEACCMSQYGAEMVKHHRTNGYLRVTVHFYGTYVHPRSHVTPQIYSLLSVHE